jgi:Rad3-related DNA helicase
LRSTYSNFSKTSATRSEEPLDIDSIFSDYFTPEHAELLKSLKFAIVVPQQSLRDSIAKVFKLTPGLSKGMVLTPFQVGESTEQFDLLVVDEAHRLNQRANQASGPLNKKFIEINEKLFGWDDPQKTQLDWIQKQSPPLDPHARCRSNRSTGGSACDQD